MTKQLQKISKYKPSMLQGSLHLEVSRPRASLATEHPLERRAFSILLALLAALIVGYLYFVAASIMHVIAQKEASQQSQTIELAIGSLEQRYFALSQSVSPQEGRAIGLSPITDTSYVYRPGNAAIANASSQAI